MLLVEPPGNAFPPRVVDLVYKLIFHGLETLDSRRVGPFALVFAAQMVVLEYLGELPMLRKMLRFLLFRFLGFHVLSELELDFEALFETRETAPGKGPFEADVPGQAGSPSVSFALNPKLNIEALLRDVNLQLASLLGQLSLCRANACEELVKVEVADPALEKPSPPKAELKRRFFRIEELRSREVLETLLLVPRRRVVRENLRVYNKSALLRRCLAGGTRVPRPSLYFWKFYKAVTWAFGEIYLL